MSWFHYSQNNSGGSFDEDEKTGIGTDVIIEAPDADSANTRAEALGLYFNGTDDCPCCGDRWSRAYGAGDEVPSIHGTPAEKATKGWFRDHAYIHPLAGAFRKVTLLDEKKP